MQTNEPRSDEAMAEIADMRGLMQARRLTKDKRAFLQCLDDNPQMTFRECWEVTEAALAGKTRTTPRRYPYSFDS
ncbi:hypothetical protein HZA45_02950 [Candidatus Peregrinibacteria bacterium]|nr:hypothetical protein [Candidatus Peregrinibacteria bacterium]